MKQSWWLALRSRLKKAWVWCKKYWQLLVGASIPLVIWAITRRGPDWKEISERITGDYEKEIEIINKAHEKELVDRDVAVKRYQDAIREIEEKFATQSKELDTKKRKEIKKIIETHSDNPEEITRKISELTGISMD